jgi:DNA-binding beta-propeller fold protein YncE
VRSIRVNDVEAQSSNGFATWSAAVSLALGANLLRIRAEDQEGNVVFPALEWTVTRAQEQMISPAALASDLARARLLVADATLDRLSVVDPATGSVTTVSDAGTSGLAFASPGGADVDAIRDRAIVADRGRNQLVTVALASGVRALLEPALAGDPFHPVDVAVQPFLDVAYVSEVEHGILVVDLSDGSRAPLGGTGTLVPGIGGVAVDLPRARVLATRAGLSPALLAFDSTTGAVSVVSGGAVGSGPALVEPRDVAIDPTGARALVSDAGADALVSIDLVSGDRSVLASVSPAVQPALDDPGQLVVDAFGRVNVVDHALDGLVQVELSNGERSLLVGTTVGSGITLSQPVSSISQPGGVLVLDRDLQAVVAIADASRERTLFSGRGAGSGPELVEPRRLAPGSIFTAALAYLADDGLDALLVIDQGGNRTELSGPSAGAGPALLGPRDIAVLYAEVGPLPPIPVRLVVADCPPLGDGRLIGVDPSRGDRDVMSGVQGGAPLGRPVALELLAPELLAVLDEANDALLVVDLSTGFRTILSASGQGPAFHPSAPKDLRVDLGGERIFVADAGTGRVLAVHLVSGTRTVLSGDGQGDGPRLVAPAGLETGVPPLFMPGTGGSASITTIRVLDSARSAVYVVDPDGDRVLWSK